MWQKQQGQYGLTSVVVDFQPHKDDPNQIRIAVGGNLINFKGDIFTQTVALTTSKILWNSVLSMDSTKYMCLD
jgi:hypothetical protein